MMRPALGSLALVSCTSILGVDFEARVQSDAGLTETSAPLKIDRAWSMWSIEPETPNRLSREGLLVYDANTELYWEAQPSSFDFSLAQARAHCESLAVENASGFRVPSRIELASIVKYVALGTKLDSSMAGNATTYWTASPDARDANSSWTVDFGTGVTFAFPNSRLSEVRCVKGGKSVPNTPDVRFSPGNDGSVFDSVTGLIWSSEPAGPFTDKDARVYCKTKVVGATGGFRVPSLHEAQTLIDEKRALPALAPPFVSKGIEWVSNLVSGGPNEIYVIDTDSGSSNTLVSAGPSDMYHTRCVR
jgi:hypothetical protein